jgi:hypothetical protein
MKEILQVKNFVLDRIKKTKRFIKKHQHYFLVLGIFLIVIFCASKAYFYINSYDFYKYEIKTFITPPVTIDNKTYEITDGDIYSEGKKMNPGIGNFFLRFKVLRLAYFSIQVRIDPLFGLEGQDLDQMSHSIDLIKNSNDSLPDFKDIKDKNFIRDNIVPTQFLSGLKDLEVVRRSLTETPSQEIAAEYNKLLKNTISNYIASLQNLAQIANQIQQSDSRAAHKDIYFLGGSLDISGYIRLFNSLESNALDRQYQQKNRISCYAGQWKKCELLKDVFHKNLPASNKTTEVLNNYSSFKDFSSFYGYQYDIIASFLEKQGAKYSYSQKPIIGIKTQCFGNDKNSDYSFFVLTWLHANGESIFRPRLINNLFFLDLTKFSSSYYDPLRKNGYRYFWQPETGFYECPDLDYQSKLTSFYAIAESLRDKPIFGDLDAKNENLKQIKLAENALSNEVVNEDEFNNYFTLAAQLISKEGEIKLSETIDRQKILDFERLSNVYKQNSAGLSQLIISGWKQSNNFKKMVKANEDKKIRNENDLAYYFVRRSAPAAYFLTTNATITEEKHRFFDEIWRDNFLPNGKENLFTLDTNSKEDILNIMDESYRILESNKETKKK